MGIMDYVTSFLHPRPLPRFLYQAQVQICIIIHHITSIQISRQPFGQKLTNEMQWWTLGKWGCLINKISRLVIKKP